MLFLIIFPLVSLFILICFTLISRIIFGPLLSDKKDLEALTLFIRGSQLGNTVLYRNDKQIYISDVGWGDIFSYYYIFGIGRIPRWSKMHKLIKARYKELYLLRKQEFFN